MNDLSGIPLYYDQSSYGRQYQDGVTDQPLDADVTLFVQSYDKLLFSLTG